MTSIISSVFRRLPKERQDQVIVLGYFVLGSVLYLTGIYPVLDHGDAPIWQRIALLFAICVPLLLRRKAPLLGMAIAVLPLAGDLALGLSAPILIVFGDHLYSAVLYSSRQVSRTIAVLGPMCVLVGTALALALVPSWRLAIFLVVAVAPFIVIPVWWAANIRQHRALLASERAASEQLSRIAELDRKAAVGAERARMARDLHDVVAGHLSAIAIQSQAAMSLKYPETVSKVLASVRENSVSALTEMRAIIKLLRAEDAATEDNVSPPRLAELSKLIESATAAGIHVEVHNALDDAGVELPAAVDLAAYRIAQEALTNAIKHAPGARASVSIRHSEGMITLEISNELAEETTSGDTGIGLLNMRERATAIGGSLFAGPAERGWLVRAVLPVEKIGAVAL
ncbi:two-component histidine kinase [Saccharomonospora azurea SZMC 14600]|uniref:sensor histidine kinase n=1 Tax=Saccharomonospora azurea TaxID=40988 RepID=UPI00023FF061|nr:histidine kinase [Saccharomonospora azurea]EHK80176.1 two-component histidine kinase [Saccharomonospora azurea SZMC 14600]EHK88436.1 two-component histidine kinase [Saccharomonospora azurea SZMC 14600]